MAGYTTVVNNPARRIFAPMFRARWQNMQNIVNDSAYLAKIPPQYKTYYMAFVQQWMEWARGFVPQLHRQEFFSTGTGNTVCDLLTKLCMAGGFRVASEDDATREFFLNWCVDDLTNVFNKMFFLANAGGNALLVLTPVDGELYPSVMPINRAVFSVGRTGRVTQCMLLNRFEAGETCYYAKETRAEVDGKAFWKVQLSEATTLLSPAWGQTWLKRVPDIIKTQWTYCYGDIEPNKWYEFPERMRGIGVYNVRNKPVASAVEDLPGYSDSTLHTCLDILYAIDYNYTQGQVDQYLGKSTVLIPKQMQGHKIMGALGTLTEGLTFEEAVTQAETMPLEEQFYKQIGDQSLDGKPISPTFIQPSLREDARKKLQDTYIEMLAAKVGVSASMLASSLSSHGTKTDDQIQAETSQEERTVYSKRALASRAINAMLSDVAYFYGLNDVDVSVQWGRSTTNSKIENAELLADFKAGTITLENYLRKRWPDMAEEEIQEEARALRGGVTQ